MQDILCFDVADNTMAEMIPEGEFHTSLVTAIIGQSHPQLRQALAIRIVNLNQIPVVFTDGFEG